jgi:hypothetical protein
MIRPIAIQMAKRIHVSRGSATIIDRQINIPAMGTNGTQGALKGRGVLGSLLRITNTPIHTNTNANKVPIDTISPTTLTGTNAANKLTNTAKNKFDL